MLRAILFISMLVISLSANAAEVTLSDIQGKWNKIKSNKAKIVNLDDAWEFNGNNYIVWAEGKPLGGADKFTLLNNEIILEYGKIIILEFTGDSMKTEYYGTSINLQRAK